MKNSKWITTISAFFLLNCQGKNTQDEYVKTIVDKIKSGEYTIKRHYNNLGFRSYLVEVWKKN